MYIINFLELVYFEVYFTRVRTSLTKIDAVQKSVSSRYSDACESWPLGKKWRSC